MRDFFWLTTACWAFVSAFFAWRWVKRRHVGSIVPAVMPWFAVAYSGREGHWIPLWMAHWPTTAALLFGVFGAWLYGMLALAELRRWWVDTEPMKRLRVWVKR